MNIYYGNRPRPLELSATTRYQDEEIADMIKRVRAAGHPVFLHVENYNIAFKPEEARLAAAVVAAYHNQIAYNAPPEEEWEGGHTGARAPPDQEPEVSD